MTLSPEDILAQLRTRGFEEGFQRTPLRHFRGKLTSITGNMIERFQPPRLEVQYNFEDLEVLDSTEPYPFPIAQISIMHSMRKRSGMGYFGASVDRVINANVPEDAPAEQVKGQDYLIGKEQEWMLTPGHMIWDGNAGEERPRECWELISIIGEGSSSSDTAASSEGSAIDRALQLLDGKTEQQWHQEVFQDPVVKGDGGLVSSIIGREFLPPLEAAGTVTKDEDGVYHVT